MCNGSIDSLYQQRLAGLFHGPASTIKHAASTARGSRQNRHDVDQDPHQVSNASPFSTAPFGCPCQESIVVYYCARTCTAYKQILNHPNALPSAWQTLKNTRKEDSVNSKSTKTPLPSTFYWALPSDRRYSAKENSVTEAG